VKPIQDYQHLTSQMPVEKKAEKRERLSERNEKIRADYMKEWARGFRTDKIIADLGSKYFLDAYTLEAIVFKRGIYAEF
jgi:hypothetical protein